LSGHGAIESLSGMAIMLSPIVLPVSAAGLVVLAVVGALVTGAGLGVTSTTGRVGVVASRSDSVAAHTGLDGALVLLSAGGSLALALAGQGPAAGATAWLRRCS